MKGLRIVVLLAAAFLTGSAQNDLDAIRYSRTGVNGTSRFNAMGGAFGAVGADVSCAAYNPAGLAVFRKGEFTYSAAASVKDNAATIYNHSTNTFNGGVNFNNFGFVAPWLPQSDKESRNVFAFTVSQPLNFNNSVSYTGYTNSNSIARDMLNLAVQKGNPKNLNSSYEGLGFDVYLLDTVNNNFFTYVDTKRSVLQKRDIVTAGRLNDINFSFAHTYKDKIYLGVSLGVPQLKYESTTTHTEADDKDSMRVTLTSTKTYSTTYVDGLAAIDTNWLGFNSLSYKEYFKTTGSGFNLKFGAVARLNDMLRVGMYYHTSTYYNLTDVYYNSMSMTFDRSQQSPIKKTYPETSGGGYYTYRLVTPPKLGLNLAIVLKKYAVIGIDYENINYRSAQLQSDTPSDFDGPNAVLKTKYGIGNNLRIGAELNLKPFMYRVGYSMQGSPYGHVFTGNYVRNTFSCGIGFRTVNNVYFDFTLLETLSREPYYMFTTLPAGALFNYKSVSLAATVGLKF